MSLEDYDVKKIAFFLIFIALLILVISYTFSFLGKALSTQFSNATDKEDTLKGVTYWKVSEPNKILMQATGSTELELGETAEKSRTLLTLNDAVQQNEFTCTSPAGKTTRYEAGRNKIFVIATATLNVGEAEKKGGVLAGPLPTELPSLGGGSEEVFKIETSSLNFKLLESENAHNITLYQECPFTYPLDANAIEGAPVTGSLIFKVPEVLVNPAIQYNFDANVSAQWLLRKTAPEETADNEDETTDSNIIN